MEKENPEPNNDEPPLLKHKRKWRDWHEREILVKANGYSKKDGVSIKIDSKELKTELEIEFPNHLWQKYPKENKIKLVDNITYVFTAHFPFLLKGNIRLEYNTAHPHIYSWTNYCFMQFLPAYWYLYQGKRGTTVFPMLKTLLNSRAFFSENKDVPPRFPETKDENIIIPFTFGKDSFLTYHIAKEIGLHPTLVYFDEPTEAYSKKHKLLLIKEFYRENREKIYNMDNPLGLLRDYGEGWFGWEMAITSWALLSLPFAYQKKAGYIVFSNEHDTAKFLYDKNGFKMNPDFEQSPEATEELSIATQALSEGEVYTTTFINGLKDLGIIAILKNRYHKKTFKYLMSCWAENKEAENKKWCGNCSKCARLYVYLTANGIDPIREAGFENNMLLKDKRHFFNVFGEKAFGTGWDAFGLNIEEQSFAFYITYLRGNRDPLIKEFSETANFKYIQNNFRELVHKYYSLHEEHLTPPQWKKKIDMIYKKSLRQTEKEILKLK